MKYSDKYPDMIPIHDDRDGIIRSPVGKVNPCLWCKEKTEYVEINYEASFCSEECLANFEKMMGLF